MIKGYQSDIMKIYENFRTSEEKALKERRVEIEKKVPQILEIEREIGRLSIKLSINILNDIDNREKFLEDLKEKITDLRIKKSELLVSYNYPLDYLETHYRCDKCKDTGFIGNQRCSCYKQLLVQLYYDRSDLKELLKNNNFDNFNFDLYSSRKSENEPESPRKNIERNVSKAWNFIEDFSTTEENLLFFGNAGTGKTFLSNCIAKELLDKGYLVVYRTSEELIQNLKHIRYENDEQLEDLLLNCDLLVIDDLGSEQITDFSKTELFNFLNRKLLKNKKMLISTNCSLELLLRMYSERISSRLLGNFTLCKFIGDDIRLKSKYK